MAEAVTVITLFFSAIIIIPVAAVFIILAVCRHSRKKKIETYSGVTWGTIEKIVSKGLDHPWVLHVTYSVDGKQYKIKETAKMKSEAIRFGKIPVGQRKTFQVGAVREGDLLEIHFDKKQPQKAIIYKNNGSITG